MSSYFFLFLLQIYCFYFKLVDFWRKEGCPQCAKKVKVHCWHHKLNQATEEGHSMIHTFTVSRPVLNKIRLETTIKILRPEGNAVNLEMTLRTKEL